MLDPWHMCGTHTYVESFLDMYMGALPGVACVSLPGMYVGPSHRYSHTRNCPQIGRASCCRLVALMPPLPRSSCLAFSALPLPPPESPFCQLPRWKASHSALPTHLPWSPPKQSPQCPSTCVFSGILALSAMLGRSIHLNCAWPLVTAELGGRVTHGWVCH